MLVTRYSFEVHLTHESEDGLYVIRPERIEFGERPWRVKKQKVGRTWEHS